MLKLILVMSLVVLLAACQVDNTTLSPEEQEIEIGLGDLNDLDKLTEGLDEDVTLDELDNLVIE